MDTNLITLLDKFMNKKTKLCWSVLQSLKTMKKVIILTIGIIISTWVLQVCSRLLIIFMNTNPHNLRLSSPKKISIKQKQRGLLSDYKCP